VANGVGTLVCLHLVVMPMLKKGETLHKQAAREWRDLLQSSGVDLRRL